MEEEVVVVVGAVAVAWGGMVMGGWGVMGAVAVVEIVVVVVAVVLGGCL